MIQQGYKWVAALRQKTQRQNAIPRRGKTEYGAAAKGAAAKYTPRRGKTQYRAAAKSPAAKRKTHLGKTHSRPAAKKSLGFFNPAIALTLPLFFSKTHAQIPRVPG